MTVSIYTLGFLLGGSCRLNFGISLEGAYGILFEDTFLPIVSICGGRGGILERKLLTIIIHKCKNSIMKCNKGESLDYFFFLKGENISPIVWVAIETSLVPSLFFMFRESMYMPHFIIISRYPPSCQSQCQTPSHRGDNHMSLLF